MAMGWAEILLTLTVCNSVLSLEVEIVNQWPLFDYNFPYDYELINRFRPENTVFTGLEVTADRLFLATPRLRAGVPATLSWIPRNLPRASSPKLNAYPDWSFHTSGKGNYSCSGLVSVYRMRKDSCNRLWVVDSGVRTSLDDFTRVCPPKLVIIDLFTDRVVRSVVFPRQVLRPNSLLTNLVIDESVQGKCDKAFAYISDTAAPGLVIFDGAKDTTWRIMHPAMFPDPNFSDYEIDGEKFTLMDGIVGLAHSPKLGLLFFQPLATDRIFSVSTRSLQKGPLPEGATLPVSFVGRKSSQGLGLAVNVNDDSLYFSPLAETSVASWNPVTNSQSLILYDKKILQFPAELRWIGEDGSIWVLSTRFQKFFRRTVTGQEINLRIIRIRDSNNGGGLLPHLLF